MSKIRVGVVGVGHIGREHARIYSRLPEVEFVGMCDLDGQVAEKLAQKHGVKSFPTVQALADVIDAATVATPTNTHHEIAGQLLRAGKHVLVEKPIADNTEQARELIELAASKGLVLQVGHIERFNPALGALEEKLTHPRFIEAHRLSAYPGRSTDIGVVLDLMIHDIEVVLHLVRSPLVSVDSVGTPVLSKGEDIANARLRFENGCVANLTASRISPERMRKIRVFSGPTNPCYISLDYRVQEGFLYRVARDGEEETPFIKKILAAKLGIGKDSAIVSEFAGRKIVREPVPINKDEPLKLELQHFVECVRAQQTPMVSGEAGKRALDLAFEITRQIQQQSK
jgi:predicted dehydrogenase